jgi:hypothetical protein
MYNSSSDKKMQDNINHNEYDNFSDLFRKKLENHKVPVDATIWDEIASRLKTPKRRIIPFWGWISGGAAVAALALLFIVHPFTESKDVIVKSNSIKVHHSGSNNGSIADYRQPKTIQSKPKTIQLNNTTIKSIPLKTLASNQVHTTIEPDYPPAQMVIRDTTESKRENGTSSGNKLNEENNVAENSKVHKDSVSGKARTIPNSLMEESLNETGAKVKNKNGWLLATSVGLNGSVPTGDGNYPTTLSNQNIVSNATGYPNIMKPNDFSNIIYSTPLSVGLIIRKNITRTWSLESGFEYTYLLTTFKSTVVQQNNAKLHLHYIGVPLNLIAQLWDNPKWNFYLSGGGMLEKGIRSVYVQNQYSNNQTVTTTTSTNIGGVQWSVNGAVGTTYKIQQNIGLFFEPKISYYFNNNQPISIRSENPVVFGLSAGIRFQFK